MLLKYLRSPGAEAGAPDFRKKKDKKSKREKKERKCCGGSAEDQEDGDSSEPEADAEHTAGALREAVRQLERSMGLISGQAVSCCGVTLAQCHVLVEIGRAGGLTMGQAAQLLRLDISTMSRSVVGLEKLSLVCRQPNPLDGRSVRILLTPQGEAMFRNIEETMQAQYTTILSRLPERRHDKIIRALLQLAEAMEGVPESGCCVSPGVSPEAED